ncbi:MAG: arylsulfatase [Bacteroidota bacterium]
MQAGKIHMKAYLVSFLFSIHLLAFPQTTPPNVILIVADDMGWKDVSYHGSEIQTPTLDRLASEGVELNRFYVHPTCSPTRSSLMTGKAALRLGFLNPLGKNNVKGLGLSEKIMPQYFKESGYQTALVGKWHLGRYKKEYWPINRGFDHFYGYLTGGIGHYDHVHGGGLDWQRNGKTLREEAYSTHLLTAEAVKLIEEKPEHQPLFLEICYSAPHLPNEAPPEAVAQYPDIQDENRRLHAAMVSELDRGIQQIYEALERKDLLDNSIIWFTSDNGGLNSSSAPEALREGIQNLTGIFGTPLPLEFLEFFRQNMVNGAADNGPFRRGKTSIYEGGVRVPAFIYAPNLLESRKINARLSINDVLPSLAAAVGFDNFNSQDLDGANQWDFLSGKTTQASPTNFIIHAIDAEAYYKDDWKLIIPTDGERELYQLSIDSTESQNVIAQYPEIAVDLFEEYEAFPRGEVVDDPLWKTFMDMDKFGGEEDRPPYAGLEGINAGPLHPIYYILPTFFLLLFLFIRWRVKKRRRRKAAKKIKSLPKKQ